MKRIAINLITPDRVYLRDYEKTIPMSAFKEITDKANMRYATVLYQCSIGAERQSIGVEWAKETLYKGIWELCFHQHQKSIEDIEESTEDIEDIEEDIEDED